MSLSHRLFHRSQPKPCYGKRWGIECGLRDTKDSRFGMGLGSIHVSTPERRDRLWLLNAFPIALPTLLGAAREALGDDQYLKSHHQATHPLAIPAGLHALRIDPHNAGGAIAAVDQTVAE